MNQPEWPNSLIKSQVEEIAEGLRESLQEFMPDLLTLLYRIRADLTRNYPEPDWPKIPAYVRFWSADQDGQTAWHKTEPQPAQMAGDPTWYWDSPSRSSQSTVENPTRSLLLRERP